MTNISAPEKLKTPEYLHEKQDDEGNYSLFSSDLVFFNGNNGQE